MTVLGVPAACAALIGVAQLLAPAASQPSSRAAANGGPAADQLVRGQTGTPSASASATDQAADPATTPTVSRTSPAVPVVRGRYVLRAPAQVPAGSSVQFVLQGPARFTRTTKAAPYDVRFDTRAVPDGLYRLVVSVITGGTSKVASTSSLEIENHAGVPASTVTMSASAAAARPTSTPIHRPYQPPASSRPGTTTTSRSSSAGGSGGGSGVPASGSSTDQVVSLTNAERAAAGCPALTVDGKLTAVAQAHSADMAARGYFDHSDREGHTPFDRMTAAGYVYRAAAENIAAGQRTPADVLEAWMNSPGHRANILNCALTQIGVGYATGGSYGSYWTQDFGTPR